MRVEPRLFKPSLTFINVWTVFLLRMKNYIYQLTKQINKHNSYRYNCINLIASENLMSPATRISISSDLGNRYTVGQPSSRWYAGCHYYDKIEKTAINIAQKLFHAEYINLQPISGMVANMVSYHALLKPNDLMMSLKIKHSGHYSHVNTGMLSLFNVKVASLPFDEKEYTINLEKAEKVILKRKPKVVLLGTSEYLFPVPLKEFRKICDKTGTKIMYDAAHVSGLIAGQTFQNPLTEGADLLSMSTNKTLSAPDHGIVACNDPKLYRNKIEHGIVPMFTSNHHAHHVAGLAITLAEFEQFGHEYASQVIKNAQALAKALYNQGIAVLCPHKNFTRSHTVLFDAKRSGNEAMRLLEMVNIIVNPSQLPWNKETDPTGIRIGTNEITRLGMKEEVMNEIARFISDAVLERKPIKRIRSEVIEFRKSYRKIQYCFDDNLLKN